MINDVENQSAARAAAGKLVSVVEQPFRFEGRELPLKVSVGLSVYPDHDSDLEALMSLADLDMYRIKRSLRRRCRPRRNPPPPAAGGRSHADRP
ncbi:diguanylate cyclase [Alkalilimnicola sp. S0819]|nr:diguanylate cyclase [Alkalilimnicola sp. S0819]MPQ17738.1 diguanylate cyclase [Alkalilimnicola sp. S0819]